jgi:hypothetical protein
MKINQKVLFRIKELLITYKNINNIKRMKYLK